MEQDNSYLRLLRGHLYAAPVWWFMGMNLFAYHAMAFLLFFSLTYLYTRDNRGIYLAPSFYYLFLVTVVYAFSLIIHRSSAGGTRFIASLHNLTFWVMGWMLIVVIANVFTIASIRRFLKVFAWLSGFIGTLALIVLVAAKIGYKSISFMTPLYHPIVKLLGRTPLIENSLLLKPLHLDWLTSGVFPRFNVLCPYSTASGYLILIVLMLLLAWGATENRLKSPFFIYLMVSTFIALVLTLSRTAVIAFLGSYMAVFFLQKNRSVLWFLLFLVGLMIMGSSIGHIMEWLLNLRAGSTVGRVELYKYSLGMFEGVDWIIGFGYKPREESAFLVPIGSHSTYLSMLFKTGITGTLFLVLFQFQLLYRWFIFRDIAKLDRDLMLIWQALGGVFIGIGLCMFTGDIDAPQIVAFLYFALIGVFEGCVRDAVLVRKLSATAKSGQVGAMA